MRSSGVDQWFYRPDYGVGYVFCFQCFLDRVTFIALLPYFIKVKVISIRPSEKNDSDILALLILE